MIPNLIYAPLILCLRVESSFRCKSAFCRNSARKSHQSHFGLRRGKLSESSRDLIPDGWRIKEQFPDLAELPLVSHMLCMRNFTFEQDL
jgi:hypothetical protein